MRGGAERQREKAKGCSCKKSHCLKLYCECLAAQRMCSELCNCEGCKNCPEAFTQRERAIAAILDRNPLAFQPKVASGSSQHLRGCNCRKSGCMKNYCECFQAGVPCTARCACHQCRNTDTFVSAKKVVMMGGVAAAADALSAAHAEQQQQQRPPLQLRGKAQHKALRRRPSAGGRSAADQAPPPPLGRGGSSRRASALELLSESARPAARVLSALPASQRRFSPPSSAAEAVLPLGRADAGHFARARHPQPTAMGATERVAPSFAKRKYTKEGPSAREPGDSGAALAPDWFHQRHGTAGDHRPLPDVTRVLDGAYGVDGGGAKAGGSAGHAPAYGVMSMLCQSLLSAAMAVDASDHAMGESASDEEMALVDSGGEADARPRREGSLSPGASGLLCDEDMERDTGDEPSQADERAGVWRPRGDEDMRESRELSPKIEAEAETEATRGAVTRLAAAQERAVLQELSVWLRNMSAAPFAQAE